MNECAYAPMEHPPSQRRFAHVRAILWLPVMLVPTITTAAGRADGAGTVHVWQRWEHTLHSAKSYTNPYADVVLGVTYSGPKGQTLRTYGFWDGGNAFGIRCAFPAAGTWRWHTECSDATDAGLHNQSGQVRVVSYTGRNPLYRHGFLQVSPSRRYLIHADGTPFLWIGDTAWVGPMHAAAADWDAYLADRVSKRFSVVQIGPAPTWAGRRDALGNTPFVGEGLAQWNPAFWREYDRKVERANQRGLMVMLVGLMEPTSRYPSSAEARLFARQLVARLYGNFVAFSPSFDSPYMPLGDEVGAAVRDATSVHLITQHPGTDLDAAERYHSKSYVDFAGLQSGAGWGTNPLSPEIASRNAVEWSARMYRMEPPKPFVLLEARYDSGLNQGQMPRLPRSCGYLAMLSGAAGYTYGCAGLWNWGGPAGDDPQSKPWSWREGMAQPSSVDMKRMAGLFSSIRWWELVPRPDLIRAQPAEWTRTVAMAATPKMDLALVYLPDNPQATIGMEGFPGPVRAKWFNPATGESKAVGGAVQPTGEHTFSRPGAWGDAVLILTSSPGRR